MFYKILLLLFSFALYANLGRAQINNDSTLFRSTIKYLCDTTFEGRAAGSQGEAAVAAFLQKELKNFGLKPKIQKFEYRYENQTYKSQNVYTFINNKAKKTILISAHYDHLGHGGQLSKSPGSTAIHPGADDNGSGVALLLAFANSRKYFKQFNFNFIIVFYGSHENGLWGSQYFYQHLPSNKMKPDFLINFDMVGRMEKNQNKLLFSTNDTALANELSKAYSNNFHWNASSIFWKDVGISRLQTLDTKFFAADNIVGISLTTGMHDDYHKISDTPDKINTNGMYQILWQALPDILCWMKKKVKD